MKWEEETCKDGRVIVNWQNAARKEPRSNPTPKPDMKQRQKKKKVLTRAR